MLDFNFFQILTSESKPSVGSKCMHLASAFCNRIKNFLVVISHTSTWCPSLKGWGSIRIKIEFFFYRADFRFRVGTMATRQRDFWVWSMVCLINNGRRILVFISRILQHKIWLKPDRLEGYTCIYLIYYSNLIIFQISGTICHKKNHFCLTNNFLLFHSEKVGRF